MTLEEVVQLEFPFTIKGFMQQRAISQDLFLHNKYTTWNFIREIVELDKVSYDTFLEIAGKKYMSVYAKGFPINYETTSKLIK